MKSKAMYQDKEQSSQLHLIKLPLLHCLVDGILVNEPRGMTPPSWINRHAEVWNESIMCLRDLETGSKERDREGEGKSLAYERGSMRGERFCVIINRIVSTCTGNVLRIICFTLSNSKLHVYVHVAIQL